MQIGVICRADRRGIGYQTREFRRHMPVARTLIVDLLGSPWENDMSEFHPDDLVVPFDGLTLPEAKVREWLTGLDVVFAVENIYDWRMIHWAHQAGCRVVVQGNPEFYLHPLPEWNRDHPDEWWWPTSWLTHRLPMGRRGEPRGRVMPVPVPDDTPHLARNPDEGPLQVSYVIGHAAHRDRAGALLVQHALQLCKTEFVMRVYHQDAEPPCDLHTTGLHKVQTVVHGAVEDRWQMYAGAHLLLSARRYGGLSLPTIEALGAGLAVAMPFGSPNTDWPVALIDAQVSGVIRTQAGPVPHLEASPFSIADTLDHLNVDRAGLAAYQEAAVAWRDQNTWASWRPRYLEALAEVCR